MVSTVRQLSNELHKIEEDNFITAIDQDGNEFIIKYISRQKLHNDDFSSGYWALNLEKVSETGCLRFV